jgi:hypothetical protein
MLSDGTETTVATMLATIMTARGRPDIVGRTRCRWGTSGARNHPMEVTRCEVRQLTGPSSAETGEHRHGNAHVTRRQSGIP